MPGGSWSNSYDWFACEVRDASGCFCRRRRPSHRLHRLHAGDGSLTGSWTVSINQHRAAARLRPSRSSMATSTTRRSSVSTETVSTGGRSDSGQRPCRRRQSRAASASILWEVGNEVYGGKPEAGGDQCADFGWEDVWTCDGTEYVLGDETHDGYLADPGGDARRRPDDRGRCGRRRDPSSWSDWGDEVIAAAGDELDFYVVHEYGFDGSPDGERPWPARHDVAWHRSSAVRASLGDSIPIAVTEYNLVSFEAGDTEQTMTQSDERSVHRRHDRATRRARRAASPTSGTSRTARPRAAPTTE